MVTPEIRQEWSIGRRKMGCPTLILSSPFWVTAAATSEEHDQRTGEADDEGGRA